MARSFVAASSQYLRYAGALLSGPPFTVSAWVYPANYTAARTIFWLGVDATGNQAHVMMVSVNTGTITVRSRNTTSRNAVTSTSVTLNAWNHACGVWAATNDRRAFLNGGGKGTDTSSVTDATWTGTEIGRLGGSGPAAYMDGRIAEVSVWNADLSDAEVAALGAGASPLQIRRGSLVAYWPLFGLASPEPEYVGSGNGMTVTGATLDNHAPVRSSFAIPGPWGWQGAFKAAGGTTNYQTLAVTATLTPLIVRQINKPLAVGLTVTPAFQRQTSKTLAVNATLTAVLQKQIAKTLAVTPTLTAALATIKTKVVAMAVNVTLTPVIQKQVNKTLAVTATITPAIQRRISKTLAVTATLTTALQKQISKTMAVSVTLTPSLAKQVVKLVTMAVSMVLTPALQRQIGKGINAAVTFTPTIQKQVGKTLAVTTTLTAVLQKQVSKTLSAAITMAVTMSRQVSGGPTPQTPGQGVPIRPSGRANLIAGLRETLRSRGRSSIEPDKKE